MTVVSIRCQTCDEVKREEHIELGSDGAKCDDCRTSDKVKEMKEAKAEAAQEPDEELEEEEGTVEPKVGKEPEPEPEEAEGESEDEDEDGEEETMTPDNFDHQSARSW